MRRYLPVLILLSTLIPLVAIGWLGLNLADKQQMATQVHFNELLAGRLEDIVRLIEADMLDKRRSLEKSLMLFPDNWSDAKEALDTGSAFIYAHFVLDQQGKRVYPHRQVTRQTKEQGFLQKTQRIWNESLLLQAPASMDIQVQPKPVKAQKNSTYKIFSALSESSVSDEAFISRENLSARASMSNDQIQVNQAFGWFSWYMEDGINLLFWRSLPDGGTLGREIDRLELLARLIGILPAEDGTLPKGRIKLLDTQGRILYQWGGYEPAKGAKPAAERSLVSPLQSWRLEYHIDPQQLAGDGSLQRLQLFTFLAGMLLMLLSVAFFLYREVRRTLHEAAQQVNFVNQVSHELKTPLTNIRLYAELLQSDLDEDDARSHKIEIIVAETGRLSRLIGNVLNFARNQRKTLNLRPSWMDMDECVLEVLDQFRPALARLELKIDLDLDASREIHADRDAMAQIIGNLIGNVEKYGAAGKIIRITTRQTSSETCLEIRDFGSGIPRRFRKRIFTAFFRIHNTLTEGVSGTGIGLSIATELATLHGGKLTLVKCDKGALFRLILPNSNKGQHP